jgi:site-specific recombinase XerD
MCGAYAARGISAAMPDAGLCRIGELELRWVKLFAEPERHNPGGLSGPCNSEGMQAIIDPTLLERLRVGPLAPYLDVYLKQIEQEDFNPSSVPCQAYAIARLSRWLERLNIPLKDFDESRAREFLGRDPGIVHFPEPATIRRLVLILQEAGVLKVKQQAALTAVQCHVAGYRRYLSQQRGLSETSLPNYTSFIETFLSERFGRGEPCMAKLCATDVTSFMTSQVAKLSPGRTKLLVTALRSFFRYLLHRGEITIALAGCVPSVATWSFSAIPKSLPTGAVRRLLEEQDQTTPNGRRDYAIMVLLARLGLRAGEVVALNLDDIDWDNAVIRIHRKGGRWTTLPLLDEVGEAIAAYLRSGRPECSSRRVFLRHRAPVRGFAHTITVSSIVRRSLRRAGVDTVRTGAHLLRHSLAVDLLRKGASLSEIGDVLGHRSPDTTALYAKVDLAALRPLALPWPAGAQ